MVLPNKIWRVKEQHPVLQHILAQELNISRITAQLLINRGIYTTEHARAFFDSDLRGLHDPYLLKDLDQAVTRIERAIKRKEKILVYGDYDADGVTGTALLVQALRRLGGDVCYYIPERLEEGYGLHLEALRKARREGVSLVVTVDCGTGGMSEAVWAADNSLDLVITDHHETLADLPEVPALINPKRPDCTYPFKELAGVGVALKLVQALFRGIGASPESWLDYLDLACIGTIADLVPLLGENRILVKHGLKAISLTKNQGLVALISLCGIKAENLGPREVGFILAPRLNAAGRIGSANQAVELLLTESPETAREIAAQLHRGNQDRQGIESVVLEQALQMYEQEPGLAADRVIVLAGEGWHPGVIGIVASRLVERFYRPALLIALGKGAGKGSARGIPGFNIYQALAHCREHLLDFGGHTAAAGLSIDPEKIDFLRRAINEYARENLTEDLMIPRLEVDALVPVNEISEELVGEIGLLYPFGHQNPGPLLGCRGITVVNSRGVGKDAAHLKLRLRGEGRGMLDGIGFRLGAYAEALAASEVVDLAFTPGINDYNGRRSVQLEVKELGVPAVIENRVNGSAADGFLAELFNSAGRRLAGKEWALYAPGFVLRVLDLIENTAIELESFVLPEFADFSTCPDIAAYRQVISYCTGLTDRPAYLLEVAARPEPAIVLVSCGHQAVELAHYLNLAHPAGPGRSIFCHNAMSPAECLAVWENFNSGAAGLVVTSSIPPANAIRQAINIVVYHLPFSPAWLAWAFDAPAAKVHLLCRSEDVPFNQRYLEALAPGRDFLAAIYLYLRREAGKPGAFSVCYASVAQGLAGCGFPATQEYTVKVAIRIFQELGLIETERGENCCRLAFKPPPASKRELESSGVFRMGHRIKDESSVWMESFWSKCTQNSQCLFRG